MQKGFSQRNKAGSCKGSRLSRAQSGSVIVYILIAVALLAALTFSFTRDSRQNVSSQVAFRLAEELYVQANLIRATIVECAAEYPNGGGDLDGDNDIDANDNPNNPYPVNPSFVDNPHGAAANDDVRNLSCTGAPTGKANIFQGSKNKGRFLPQPPSGFSEWEYDNDANGVRIRITAPASATGIDTLSRIMSKFSTCQADLNYGACGAQCLTVWVHRIACP